MRKPKSPSHRPTGIPTIPARRGSMESSRARRSGVPSSNHSRSIDSARSPNASSPLEGKLEHEESSDEMFFNATALELVPNSPIGIGSSSAGGGDVRSLEWEKAHIASEISRTSSQSTTGTDRSQSSFETTASSLSSGVSSLDAKASNMTIALSSEHPALTDMHSSASAYTTTTPAYTIRSSSEEVTQAQIASEALRRYHALHELVETEQAYAEDLDVLISTYFLHLEHQAFFSENPSRVATVVRNTSKLLELHSSLADGWRDIMEQHGLTLDDDRSHADKAALAGDAVRLVAERLQQCASLFEEYEYFCSRHAEALVMIREAERRHGGDDFTAYERMCGGLVRAKVQAWSTPRQSTSRRSSGMITPVATLAPMSPMTINDGYAASERSASGTTTPSGSFISTTTRTAGRLNLADYLIKPIQRLCLYPLVLNALLKYTPEHETETRATVLASINVMRKIADQVDEASRIREKDLMAELVIARIDPHPGLPLAFLKSLGSPQLSGTLDVLYHHSFEQPLSTPVRFLHLGVVMWSGYVLFVRTRKNRQLECCHWLPLAGATVLPEKSAMEPTLSSLEGIRPLSPYSFRLTSFGHHFELCASNEQEHRIWHDALRLAAEQAGESADAAADAASADSLVPCSLNRAAATSQQTGGEALADLLSAYTRPSTVTVVDGLFKFPSVSTRLSVDKAMIFSDVLITPTGVAGVTNTTIGGSTTVREISAALISQQLRKESTPTIGSAVGAAMGLAKIASIQMSSVKRVRKLSGLTPIDTSVLRGQPAEPTDEDTTMKSSAETHATPKRNSFSTLRANSSTSDTLSSPAESLSSRVRGTLARTNSRLAGSRVTKSPTEIGFFAPSVDETLAVQSPSSAVDGACPSAGERSPQHSRSKSNPLRDIWSASVGGHRTRSQSAQSALYLTAPQEGIVAGRILPISNQEALSSSPPALDDVFDGLSPALDSPTADEFDGLLDRRSSVNYTDTAPNSQASSRRPSLASILSWTPSTSANANGNGQLQSNGNAVSGEAVKSSRTSSPVLSMTSIRNGAAASLKRAKSTARHRPSVHGIGSAVGSGSGSSGHGGGIAGSSFAGPALPLASDASAQGCISRASSTSAATVQPQNDVVDDDSPELSAKGERMTTSEGVTSNDSIVSRLRGSLIRSVSMRASRRTSMVDPGA